MTAWTSDFTTPYLLPAEKKKKERESLTKLGFYLARFQNALEAVLCNSAKKTSKDGHQYMFF